jgi:hypothetical protein
LELAFNLEGLAIAVARIAVDQQPPAQLGSAVRLLGAAARLREEPAAAADRYWNTIVPLAKLAACAQQVSATRALLGKL